MIVLHRLSLLIFALENDIRMSTFIVLAVYIVGVYIAYFQLQKWADHEIYKKDEFHTVFMVSLLSWFIFPIYGLVYMFQKCEEG